MSPYKTNAFFLLFKFATLYICLSRQSNTCTTNPCTLPFYQNDFKKGHQIWFSLRYFRLSNLECPKTIRISNMFIDYIYNDIYISIRKTNFLSQILDFYRFTLYSWRSFKIWIMVCIFSDILYLILIRFVNTIERVGKLYFEPHFHLSRCDIMTGAKILSMAQIERWCVIEDIGLL